MYLKLYLYRIWETQMKARHTFPMAKINRRERLIAGSGSGQLPGAVNCREQLIAGSGPLPGAAKC